MSRVDDLIAEMCPDGVEFWPLEKLFTLRNGYTPSKSDSSYWDDGTIPWFRMEDIRANGRILDDSLQKITPSAVKGGRLFPADSLLVATSATIGEHALVTVPHLSNQRFTSLTLRTEWNGRIDMMFAFYYGFRLSSWCQANVTTSSFSSVDMVGFRKFRFPVPPMEVQREIVRILDTFSALEAELEAELEARRTQYAHYRTRLIRSVSADFPSVGLGDVATVRYGRDFPKSLQGISSGHYPFFKVIDMTRPGNSVTMTESANYVGPDELITLGVELAPAGTILLPRVGAAVKTNKKRITGVPSAFDTSFIAILPGDDMLPRYLLHLFADVDLMTLSNTGAALPSVRRDALESFQVALPPVEVQMRIVETLDNFDALVNDLSVGLPAELAARRKQYEHYRDRLLTFEERV